MTHIHPTAQCSISIVAAIVDISVRWSHKCEEKCDFYRINAIRLVNYCHYTSSSVKLHVVGPPFLDSILNAL